MTAEEEQLLAAWQETDPLTFFECQAAMGISTIYKDAAFFKFKNQCAKVVENHVQYYRSADEL